MKVGPGLIIIIHPTQHNWLVIFRDYYRINREADLTFMLLQYALFIDKNFHEFTLIFHGTIDWSSKDLPSIYLQFTFKSIIFELLLYECLPSFYLQFTFNLHSFYIGLPSIYLHIFGQNIFTFSLPSTYIQLTFSLQT